jgi:ribose transport system permease protein
VRGESKGANAPIAGAPGAAENAATTGAPAQATNGETSASSATSGPSSSAAGLKLPELGALLVFLIGLSAYFGLTTPQFFTWANIVNILDAVAVIGIVAAPVTLLMVAGQIDLSVGSGLALCAVLMAVVGTDEGVLVGILVVLGVGVGIGVINGFFVTAVGVNSLITTLAMLAMLVGAAQLISDGQTVPLRDFGGLGTSRPFADLPISVLIFIGISLTFWFISRYTVFGRSMYATGANAAAARLVGIRSKRNIVLAFVLIGLCVALSALIQVSQLGAASHNNGLGLELAVITAVVLGGTSLAGGRGTVPGTLIGLLIIGVLNNGLVLNNVDPFWQDVARGGLLLFATSFDQLRLRLMNN